MSKVYIVQNQQHRGADGELTPKFDMVKAAEFGELVELLTPTAKPFNSRPIISDLREGLREFTAQDRLLLCGNPCLIGWAVAIAAERTGGFIRLLQWSGFHGHFVEVDSNVRPLRERFYSAWMYAPSGLAGEELTIRYTEGAWSDGSVDHLDADWELGGRFVEYGDLVSRFGKTQVDNFVASANRCAAESRS